jgi:hypothetical protein
MFSEVEIQGLVYNLLQYINNNQLREQIAIFWFSSKFFFARDARMSKFSKHVNKRSNKAKVVLDESN